MKKKRSWRTTLLGVATLVLTGASVAANPVAVLNKESLAQIVASLTAGVGLITARDQKAHEEENQ